METVVATAEVVAKEKANVGKTTGLKFIQGFGHFMTKHGNVVGNRELVRQDMLAEYPRKAESIEKWLDWYKGYFNMGQIKGFNEDKKLHVKWLKEVQQAA